MTDPTKGIRRLAVPAAFLGGGLLAGAVLTGALSASAATSPTTVPGASAEDEATDGLQAPDEWTSMHPDEQLLTGDTASKVTEAALAKYPGATVLRVETDSDGVYEAHLRTADGQRVTVTVGEDFAVTGTEARGPGGPGGPGCGTGGHHAPGDDDTSQDDGTSGSPSSTDT